MPQNTSSWLATSLLETPKAQESLPDPRALYELAAPSHQNAINLMPGWVTAFPPDLRLTAGLAHLYSDSRVEWAVERFGSLAGKRILELGPLEGSHTAMLERLGARRIDAVEAHKISFLRCLVAKEIYDLRRSHFHLGDFVEGLQARTRYDFIFACGVLYHMADPLLLLERVAARTDNLYVWTHYFDEREMPPGDVRRQAFRSPVAPYAEATKTVEFHGVTMNFHQRSYHEGWKKTAYYGGPVDQHFWLEKGQIADALRALGFNDLAFAHEAPDHPNGPATSIYARRV